MFPNEATGPHLGCSCTSPRGCISHSSRTKPPLSPEPLSPCHVAMSRAFRLSPFLPNRHRPPNAWSSRAAVTPKRRYVAPIQPDVAVEAGRARPPAGAARTEPTRPFWLVASDGPGEPKGSNDQRRGVAGSPVSALGVAMRVRCDCFGKGKSILNGATGLDMVRSTAGGGGDDKSDLGRELSSVGPGLPAMSRSTRSMMVIRRLHTTLPCFDQPSINDLMNGLGGWAGTPRTLGRDHRTIRVG